MTFKCWPLLLCVFLVACEGGGSAPAKPVAPLIPAVLRMPAVPSQATRFLGTWEHARYSRDRVQITMDAGGQFALDYTAANMMGGVQNRRAQAVLEKDALVDRGMRVAQILDNGHLLTEGREYVRTGSPEKLGSSDKLGTPDKPGTP